MFTASLCASNDADNPLQLNFHNPSTDELLQTLRTLHETLSVPPYAYKEFREKMKALVLAGANPNAFHPFYGVPFLEIAVTHNDLDLVRISLQKSAGIRLKRCFDRPYMDRAVNLPLATVRSPEMAQLLLEAKADPEAEVEYFGESQTCLGLLAKNPECPISVLNYIQATGRNLKEVLDKDSCSPLYYISLKRLQIRGFERFAALLFFGIKPRRNDYYNTDEIHEDKDQKTATTAKAIIKVMPRVVQSQKDKHRHAVAQVVPKILAPCVMDYVGQLSWGKMAWEDTRKRMKREMSASKGKVHCKDRHKK